MEQDSKKLAYVEPHSYTLLGGDRKQQYRIAWFDIRAVVEDTLLLMDETDAPGNEY